MSFLKVQKQNLLWFAAVVWVVAGVNILIIGLNAYAEGFASPLNEILSVVVGCIFWFGMFYRLTKKHTKRIREYDAPQYFWHFFDLKSFIIMAVMMTGGIALRVSGVVPTVFIAVLYTGLGAALALAGLRFAQNRMLFASQA